MIGRDEGSNGGRGAGGVALGALRCVALYDIRSIGSLMKVRKNTYIHAT